ncbi:MAG: type II toxin-antitoxin system RelE/ParE family toxin [Thioalkalivibrio sp.]|jgi:plasmid stabilization system protein ParE|nr:type II toxin-antitoxin system RelE/ParE family toxin [Thioalkalivibrio sp.]
MVEVRLAPQAEQDLLEIWLYIANDHPVNVDRFLDRLDSAAQQLAQFTEMDTVAGVPQQRWPNS